MFQRKAKNLFVTENQADDYIKRIIREGVHPRHGFSNQLSTTVIDYDLLNGSRGGCNTAFSVKIIPEAFTFRILIVESKNKGASVTRTLETAPPRQSNRAKLRCMLLDKATEEGWLYIECVVSNKYKDLFAVWLRALITEGILQKNTQGGLDLILSGSTRASDVQFSKTSDGDVLVSGTFGGIVITGEVFSEVETSKPIQDLRLIILAVLDIR